MVIELLINIDVPDLDRGVHFYEEGLGFTMLRVLGGRVAEMQAANCRAYLLAKPEDTPATAAGVSTRCYARHWTPVHLDLSVADVDAAVAQATAAGAVLESGPTAHAWGTIAELSDPFGNGFCLIQYTEAGYDAIAD